MHVQMKFWKFENCMFCEITSSNVHGFSSNLQNSCSFIQTILMRGKSPMLTPKLHMYEIWSESKKHNILLNFWVNIGMWPIVFAWFAMPDATMMSEYMIYMVWKLVAMFCPITRGRNLMLTPKLHVYSAPMESYIPIFFPLFS